MRPRRLPDTQWLRDRLLRTEGIPMPTGWDHESLRAWMMSVPAPDWKRVSKAWDAHRTTVRLDPAPDEFTALMDESLAVEDLSEGWKRLLQAAPAKVRGSLHIAARRHRDADPWQILARLERLG